MGLCAWGLCAAVWVRRNVDAPQYVGH